MGIRELRKLASELGIKGYSKLRKPELEAAIEAAKQGNSKQVGTINGAAIIVAGDQINGQSPAEFVASLQGFGEVSPAGHRRRVRRLLTAAGYARLAIASISKSKVHSSKVTAAA